uniref:Secreted protein n=1 Tax=Steinernema glaseri TaxID=37863 RepID=A0A1I7YVY6_9BILA
MATQFGPPCALGHNLLNALVPGTASIIVVSIVAGSKSVVTQGNGGKMRLARHEKEIKRKEKSHWRYGGLNPGLLHANQAL